MHAAGASLRSLDLSDNPMTAEVAPALAELLLKHPELLALNLNDTSLTDEGVSAIAQSLHASAGSLQVSRPHRISSCYNSAFCLQGVHVQRGSFAISALTTA